VQTRAVSSFKAHPLKFYLDLGIRVTVNTDNRLITDTTVSKELKIMADTFDLSLPDVRTLITNGFKSAFVPFHEKAELLRQVNREFDAVVARHAKPATSDAKKEAKKGA